MSAGLCKPLDQRDIRARPRCCFCREPIEAEAVHLAGVVFAHEECAANQSR